MRSLALASLLVAVTLSAAPRYEKHLVKLPPGNLRVALHRLHEASSPRGAVLILHGGSIPAMLSSGYRLNGRSWMDDLVGRGFDVWALDFLNYGESDRQPEMLGSADGHPPLEIASDASDQVLRAIEFVRAKTQAPLSIVAHSWGTLVAGIVVSQPDSVVKRVVLYGAITPPLVVDKTTALPSTAYEDVSIEKQWQGFLGGVPAGHDPAIARADFDAWAAAYLHSDATSGTRTPPSVRVPSGPDLDYARTLAGTFPYDPAAIRIPVLLIRGTWDVVISAEQAEKFVAALTHSPEKRVVSIDEGTHRLHWERNRKQLFDEVALFLSE